MRFLIWAGAFLSLMLLAGFVAGRFIASRANAAYPAIGEMISVGGRTAHIYEQGPADATPERTIVMIHGASSNLREMVFAFAKRLPANIRFIAIDRPGMGLTERIDFDRDADLSVQAQFIIDAMAARGVKKAVVLGHSLGGAVALRLALDDPSRVAGLILLAPVSHPWPGGISWHYSVTSLQGVGPVFAHAIAPAAGALLADSAIKEIFAPAPVPPGYREAIGAELLLRPESFRSNAEDVAALLSQVADQATRYGSITAPMLIITADTDTVVSPVIHSETLVKAVPGAKLIRIEGAGHAPHQTRPERVTPAIIDFLQAGVARVPQVN
jgi:pimeloyl-ACP methyl ester carboxylesterase